MPIFKLTKDALEALPETAFRSQGIRERGDLQRLLRANIGAVAADVLVIAEEFAEWEDSKRRIDLLGVDKDANLVVIELKRDDDGHMELQAIRYAAMVSTMTFARAVEVFQAFLDKVAPGRNARESLLEFLGWDEPRDKDFARDVRIVLVAADFSKELTTAVLWLNKRDLDIRCVRIKPYALGADTIIDAQQVVPLPEAEEYTIQLRRKEHAVRADDDEKSQTHQAFWTQLLALAATATPRFAKLAPSRAHWLAAATGFSALRLVYLILRESAAVELYIDGRTDSYAWNKTAFDYLHGRREEIERAYGGPLSWQRIDERRACRISDDTIEGGLRSPRDEWPEIAKRMVNAMQRLEKALLPHLGAAAEHAARAAP